MLDQGNTAFVLIMAALVLFMTPGLAFFYGGLVKAKSVISMMMMSFGAIALVGVLWVLYGYAIAFANHGAGTNVSGIVGFFSIDWNQFGLGQAFEESQASKINAAYPSMAFVGFQATFAIITVALISGAIADRAKFGAWMIFAGVWVTVVYFPVASWVFNLTSGMFATWGVIDFAGGTAVHINAGAAGLALALVLGKRVGFAKGAHKPHNPPFVLLGAAILWFGWFGFNAGSEGAADGVASLAWVNTLSAPAAAVLGWLLIEKLKDGKATSVGAASGAVAGLVAITPACAALTPGWGLLLGFLAGVICCFAIDWKYRLGFDDSLDVVGVHLVGGIFGTLYLGIFANGTGLIFSGSFEQLGKQATAAAAVGIYSFIMAFVIGYIIEKTIGFRVKTEDEVAGIDTAVHGEEGYVLYEEADRTPVTVR
ncbi:ammonia channel protein [Curtobacterium sp. 'Ferrero']|uniref:ammonium transporter n=1 Tax=Curtobacterium sp. 'Ferrero' TaxID=2033654 RepID=UPI000BD359F7|nr:ammonium transporter [Curtobacterium sp. 'Ferrero']PCN47590.1 ammonia channel protein [Curtobacterium sp. 'Ferrero']